ncbi:hydrogenase maturation nickel metallochaperone HypA [Methylotenera sp.]|jgi:hydrogenase nickel incorporation protein HypA/HybF|uniref:hydrogenase maturation nickel metallochaperone HypA n=1 Tax=Methylotenera sp. TaxID=2051956 RepID=UPI00272F94FB|nr:hydrogenase maturation nickel metallochaperone HypA [Methylotenera sp.]MDP2072057.1 hydrogenase maturation nickel metallochaperone HypA [Methylotenera sp.]MDP3006933.1 hydrogenase maturation nickel metallochaperone HypA [Methylotenera sp.]MDP3007130.1 hydrogenase maturation nickel metallochaperone HypA [Methylotenera sp.]
MMHEMSLAENVLQIIEESARTQNFQRVRIVVLEIGKLSAVEPDAMRFCFDAVMRGTLAEGAELQLIETPGLAVCLACGTEVEMQEQYGLCQNCASPRLKITAGDQVRVKDLAVV